MFTLKITEEMRDTLVRALYADYERNPSHYRDRADGRPPIGVQLHIMLKELKSD